jgi:nitrite reductase/ring-hydroxylating ferredoxin subunit
VSAGRENAIPKWREDFPIEQDGDDFITRRDFLRFLTVVSGGLAVGSGAVVVRSLTHEEGPFPELEIPRAATLEPGQWAVFRYPDEKTPAMVIRRENGEYVAFLQNCPHLACPVTYHRGQDGEGETLRCHCHNGRFDIGTGKGTQGPPRELRPLRQVVLRVEDERVVAVGLNEIRIHGEG